MLPLLLPGIPGYSTVYLGTLFQTLSVLKLKSVSCDASIHSPLQAITHKALARLY